MFAIPCREIGCVRCCQPRSVMAGGMIGCTDPSYDDLDVCRVNDERNVIAHVHSVTGGPDRCSQLSIDGCCVYDRRPFVCRSYPFFLQHDRLSVSLTCPWVAKVLLPRWCDVGMSAEERDVLRSMLMSMRMEIPCDIKELWDRDAKNHYVVISLQL